MNKESTKIILCEDDDIRELDVRGYILIAKTGESSILGKMCFGDMDDIQKIGFYLMMKDFVRRMEENELMMEIYEKAYAEGICDNPIQEVFSQEDWK